MNKVVLVLTMVLVLTVTTWLGILTQRVTNQEARIVQLEQDQGHLLRACEALRDMAVIEHGK